ncbi:MAG: FtsX-like permease family protein [Clostridiales bacterium]|nr:FtsX-like permease family protein [Clostridiales bacterium]
MAFKLALKELLYNKKKYILIEVVIVLLVFMVLFLSGLVEGLGRAVVSGIDNIDADYFLLNESAEKLITVSELETEKYEQLKTQTSAKLAPLNIQRMYLSKSGESEKINVTYFAIEPNSFLAPKAIKGNKLNESEAQHPIVLDESFTREGISIGDTVYDSSSGLEFTVVGFAEDSMYGHTSIGFISLDSYAAIRKELNPTYNLTYHTIVIKGKDIKNINIDGAELVPKSEIIENIPSYKAEHLTITMIIWVLVVVTAAVIGVFYFILTIQKHKQFGVMKAIGVNMKSLAAIVTIQVCIVAVFGTVVAGLFTFIMSLVIPPTMPFYLKVGNVFIIAAAFIAISIASSLISILSISKVDPMKVIGGADE